MSDMKTFNTEKKIRKKKKIPVEYPMYAVFPQGEMAIAVATLFRRDASDLNRSCTNWKRVELYQHINSGIEYSYPTNPLSYRMCSERLFPGSPSGNNDFILVSGQYIVPCSFSRPSKRQFNHWRKTNCIYIYSILLRLRSDNE